MSTLKTKYIERARAHQEADEIIQGSYWDGNKGCCVGCLAHTDSEPHEALLEQTGIPVWLSRVADTLHEGLPRNNSKEWPLKFITAMPLQIFNQDWTDTEIDKKIKAPFLLVILGSVLECFEHAKFPAVKSAVDSSIALWQRADIGSDEWKADAAFAAFGAADAADAAADAAFGAADAAAFAAFAAFGAARAADAAEAAAEAAADAAFGAADAKFGYFSEELIKILVKSGD